MIRISTAVVIAAALPSMAAAEESRSERLARSLSQVLDQPVRQIAPLAENYLSCAAGAPDGNIARFGDLTLEAAEFAAAETYPSARPMLADFTRQLIVQTSAGTTCRELADHWQDLDPFVRETADGGIGLTESDLAAAQALEAIGESFRESVPVGTTRERVLDLWEELEARDDRLTMVLLTRLDSWTPAVEGAWDELSTTCRR